MRSRSLAVVSYFDPDHIFLMPLVASMFDALNLGGGEIILIPALLLVVFGSKKLPDLAKRIGAAFDKESADAGRSLGGIYGKPEGQAFTVDNQVAELYDAAVFQDESQLPRLNHARKPV
jgi:hypothetical protein